MRTILIVAGASLASCAPPGGDAGNTEAANQESAKRAVAASAFAVEEKTDLYEFDFSWPAEAAAIPELAARFRAEMDKARTDLLAGAEEEKARREQEDFGYTPFSSSTAYETAGQSPRLLSLRVEAGGYEGGAHGNFGIGALLWDREAKREIDFAGLFAAKANRDRLLTQRWCDALNKAREEKRGEPVGAGGMFDECPALDEIAIIPADSEKDGRFDRLLLAASPYVAGPWVEGAYEIELAVTPDLISGLRAENQASFEAQGRQ